MGTTTQVEAPLSRVARRKAKTNQRLLEVARKLFSEKVIYWGKVEDITEMADLGKGTFYKYFDSKEAIIRALLEEGLSELLGQTEHAVELASSNSKILSAMIAARVDFFLTQPDYLLFLHQIRGLMQLRVDSAHELCEVYDIHLRRLAQLVKPAIGTSGSINARDLATAIASYTSGLLTYHALFEGPEAMTHRRDHFVHMLERSLQALLKTGNGSSKPARSRRG
jgi:AcrR family transcriptional regulator